MRTFFKFQNWFYQKGKEFIHILLYFLIPYLVLCAYFAGFVVMLGMAGIILFFVGAFQLMEWPDFKRNQAFEEQRLVNILKGDK